MRPVVPEPHRVNKIRVEGMSLFQSGNMPLVDLGEQDVAEEGIGRSRRSVVKAIGREQLVILRNVLVPSNGEKILVHDLYWGVVVLRRIPTHRSVGQRFESEKFGYLRVNGQL